MEKYAKDIRKGDKMKINRNGIGWGTVTDVKIRGFVYITCEDNEITYFRKDEKIFILTNG